MIDLANAEPMGRYDCEQLSIRERKLALEHCVEAIRPKSHEAGRSCAAHAHQGLPWLQRGQQPSVDDDMRNTVSCDDHLHTRIRTQHQRAVKELMGRNRGQHQRGMRRLNYRATCRQ